MLAAGEFGRLVRFYQPLFEAGISVMYFIPRGTRDSTQTYTHGGALEDLRNAVPYFKQHVVDFNISPEHIVLGAMSGGGGITTLIGATEDPTLKYVFSLTPWWFSAVRPAGVGISDAMHEPTGERFRVPHSADNVARLDTVAYAPELKKQNILLFAADADPINPVEISHGPIMATLEVARSKHV